MYDIVNNHKKIKELNNKLSPILAELEELEIFMDVIRKPERMTNTLLKDENNQTYNTFLLTFYEGEELQAKRESVTLTYAMNLYMEYNPKELEEVCIYSFENYKVDKKEMEEEYYHFVEKKCITQQNMTFEQKTLMNKVIDFLNKKQKQYNISKEELIYFLVLSILKRNVSMFYLTADNNDLEDAITSRIKGFAYNTTNGAIESIKPKKIETIKQTKKTQAKRL